VVTTAHPIGTSVAAIDALARATRLNIADVEPLTERYKGHRNVRRARAVLNLVDAGSQSPRETWLRLLLLEAGYRRPQTQIPVYGEYGELVAVLDMGWDDIKVAVEYEGDHHRADRRQFNRDIARYDALTELGWIVVRVTAEDVPGGVLRRVAAAWSRRTCSQGEKIA
jgi:very-short-patch-repair endonuclease